MGDIWTLALQNFVHSEGWKEIVGGFVDANCSKFRSSELMHEHYAVWKEFQVLAEQILDDALKQMGGSLQALEKALDEQASIDPTGPRDEAEKDLLRQLLTFDDFEAFADMMFAAAHDRSQRGQNGHHRQANSPRPKHPAQEFDHDLAETCAAMAVSILESSDTSNTPLTAHEWARSIETVRQSIIQMGGPSSASADVIEQLNDLMQHKDDIEKLLNSEPAHDSRTANERQKIEAAEKHRTAMLAADGTKHEQAMFCLFERTEEIQVELDGLRKIYEVCQRDDDPVEPTVMEEVYLYLKEFVHNNVNLSEMSDEMHEFVYGKLGPRHAGAINELLSIMMLEEELLILRHQIQACLEGTMVLSGREDDNADVGAMEEKETGMSGSDVEVAIESPRQPKPQLSPEEPGSPAESTTLTMIQSGHKALAQQTEVAFEEEILRMQLLSDVSIEGEHLDEPNSPNGNDPHFDTPRLTELRQLATAFLAGLRKRQTAELKFAMQNNQILTDEDEEKLAQEVASTMRKGFVRAHRQMMQSLADERTRQHERLQRKLQRSRIKRTETRAQELGRELNGLEKSDIEATLTVIYQRELDKLDNNFDEQELHAILNAQAKQMMALAAVQHRTFEDAPSLFELEALKKSHQQHARELLLHLQQARCEQQRRVQERKQRMADGSKKLAWQAADGQSAQDEKEVEELIPDGTFADSAAQILAASTTGFADSTSTFHGHLMPEVAEDLQAQLLNRLQDTVNDRNESLMANILTRARQTDAHLSSGVDRPDSGASGDVDAATDISRLKEAHSNHNRALLQVLEFEKERQKAKLKDKLRRRGALNASHEATAETTMEENNHDNLEL